MKIEIFQIKNRLTADEIRLAEQAASAAGLSLDEFLERALKAAIYAPVIVGLSPKAAA